MVVSILAGGGLDYKQAGAGEAWAIFPEQQYQAPVYNLIIPWYERAHVSQDHFAQLLLLSTNFTNIARNSSIPVTASLVC